MPCLADPPWEKAWRLPVKCPPSGRPPPQRHFLSPLIPEIH